MTELPRGWGLGRIGEIAEVGPKKRDLPPDTVVSFVPMPRVEEVSGRIDLSETISVAEGKRRNLTYFEEGDVIFAKITPCMENGKIALAQGLVGGAAFGSTEFHVLRPTSDVDPRYLRYYLVHDDFRAEAERSMTGAVGQRRVPKTFLAEHSIPLPPLDEQRRIVAILEDHLSRLDAARGQLDVVESRSARLKDEILRPALTGKFPEPDVPVSEWRVTTLGDVARLIRGVTYTKSDAIGGPMDGYVPLLRATNISDSGLDFDDLVYVPERVVKADQICMPGDSILATSSGSISVVGKSGVFNSDRRVTFGAFCGVLRPSTEVLPMFLHYLLTAREVRSLWSMAARGTNINNLKVGDITGTPVLLPPVSHQRTVVKFLDGVFEQVGAGMQGLTKSRVMSDRLRRALLDAAFSGQLTKENASV